MKNKLKKKLTGLIFFKKLPENIRKQLYVVGGIFPSIYHNQSVNDIDLIVENLLGIKKNLENYFGRDFHLIRDNKGNEVLRFKFGKTFYDIFEIQRDLNYDAYRRDFTINSIFYSFYQDTIIDPLEGIRDLKNGILRACSPEFLTLDPLRFLRYYRFLLQYNLIPDDNTKSIIDNFSIKQLKKVSLERIFYELKKIMKHYSFNTLITLEEKNFLSLLFPIFNSLKGVGQNRFHSFDIYKHSLLTYKWVEYYAKYFDYYDHIFEIKMAALLHDIGKIGTKERDENGNTHFYGHEKVGEELVKQLFENIPISKREKKLIINLVKNHMYLANLKFNNMLTQRQIKKFLFITNQNIMPHIILFLSDGAAAHDKRDKNQEQFAHYVLMKITAYKKYLGKRKNRIITGKDLLNLGFTEGKLLGQVLFKVNELYFDGKINNKKEALEYAKKFLTKNT